MPQTHEKAFGSNSLSFSNTLSFDAGSIYDTSLGIWEHDLEIIFWKKNAMRQILKSKNYIGLDFEFKKNTTR